MRKMARSFGLVTTATTRTCEFMEPSGPLLPKSSNDFSGHECSFLQDLGNGYSTRRVLMGIVGRVGAVQRVVTNPRSKTFAFQDPEGSKFEYREKEVSSSVIVSLREQVNTRLSRGLELMTLLDENFREFEATTLWNLAKPMVLRDMAVHFTTSTDPNF